MAVKRIFIALLTLLSAAPAAVRGQSGSGDGYDYIINASNANTITITNYTGPGGAVIIPTHINGLTVTSIGNGENSAFPTSPTSITIPDTVTSVEALAFSFCSDLTNVTIGNGVTSIGSVAFELCDNLAEIKVPNNVTSIGSFAFDGCFRMTNVTIAKSVAFIGNDAFQGFDGPTSFYFAGNAPANFSILLFEESEDWTVYYLPGTTGWNDTGVPAVLWNPIIQAAAVQTNKFGFNITGTANIPIVVEACASLANPVWTPITNALLTNGSFHFSDLGWTHYPNRYYRISSP